jgi:cadmium resistance protein CadD (predicted permease)
MILGVTSFIATNLDDIVLLMMFFAQVNRAFRRRHIVLGQYLGFAGLLLLCLPGYWGGLVLSKDWIGVLGLLPIVVGIHHLWHTPVTTPPPANTQKMQTVELSPVATQSRKLLAPPTYQVAAVTLANGGDNVSVYVPLFASSPLLEMGVILSTFGVMVGVWCWAAERWVQHPVVNAVLTRYGHRLTPVILMGLGVYILLKNGTLQAIRALLFSLP